MPCNRRHTSRISNFPTNYLAKINYFRPLSQFRSHTLIHTHTRSLSHTHRHTVAIVISTSVDLVMCTEFPACLPAKSTSVPCAQPTFGVEYSVFGILCWQLSTMKNK